MQYNTYIKICVKLSLKSVKVEKCINDLFVEDTKYLLENYSAEESDQILTVAILFVHLGLDSIYEINNFITNNSLWDYFNEIKAVNKSGKKSPLDRDATDIDYYRPLYLILQNVQKEI
jgi:hypothetical protein